MSRAAFGKQWSNMGASGSVSYLFDQQRLFIVFAGDSADAIFAWSECWCERWPKQKERSGHRSTDLHKAIVALRESVSKNSK